MLLSIIYIERSNNIFQGGGNFMKDLGLTNYKDKNYDEACKADIVIVKSNMPAKGNYKLFSSEYYAKKYNKDCMHGHGCVLPVNVIGGKQVYLTISNEANNYINNACGIYKEHCISHRRVHR